MKKCLNLNWNFICGFKKEYINQIDPEAEFIDIPHQVKNLPINYFDEKSYQGTYTYSKYINIDSSDIANNSIVLQFEGFMVSSNVYLNGNLLGKYISGYLPVEIEISKYCIPGKNLLVVELDSREDSSIPPFGYAIDYLTFGGIYRSVNLIIRNKVHFIDLYVNANMDGKISIDYSLSLLDDNTLIEFELFDNKNQSIITFIEKTAVLKDFCLWDLKNPCLYTLKAKIFDKESNALLDELDKKFGFKTSVFCNDGFYLNGNKIKLHGLNRHQSFPYIGYAGEKLLQEEDAIILKRDLNCNVVRTSHYTQSEDFLNKCDEIGLLVINEIPGWQFISQEQQWRNNFYDFIRRMCIKERGHTSLILFGVRIDESKDDHELYSKANDIIHTLDPFHQTIGVRNFKNSELLEDVYGYNDFSTNGFNHGLDKTKTYSKQKCPRIVTEYMGHLYPTKAYDSIQRRIDCTKKHARVYDDTNKFENLSGSIGWCMVDYYTHKDFGSGDHICYHGVLDMYRNEKYSASFYKSQGENYPVLDVLSNLCSGDFNEALIGKTLIATNCDKVMLYKGEEFINEFYPNKKEYKYTAHPLVIIDDYIGNTFSEPNISNKDSKKFVDILNYVGINGFSYLPLKILAKLAYLVIKYHLSYDKLTDYWNKYIAAWGGKKEPFTFKGIIQNEVVITKTIGVATSLHLFAKENNFIIIEPKDHYEIYPLHISLLDEFNNVCTYASTPLVLDYDKTNFEIINGNSICLLGGQTTLYIKTKHINSKNKISLKYDDLRLTIEFEIKVES